MRIEEDVEEITIKDIARICKVGAVSYTHLTLPTKLEV